MIEYRIQPRKWMPNAIEYRTKEMKNWKVFITTNGAKKVGDQIINDIYEKITKGELKWDLILRD